MRPSVAERRRPACPRSIPALAGAALLLCLSSCTEPVAERPLGTLSPDIIEGFEFGDYNGMDIVMDQLIAIFTDNRQESGGSGDSIDVYAAGITPGGGAFCGNSEVDPGR